MQAAFQQKVACSFSAREERSEAHPDNSFHFAAPRLLLRGQGEGVLLSTLLRSTPVKPLSRGVLGTSP